MEFVFVVRVTAERVEGKFASREELQEQLQDALDNADPSTLTGDEGGEYEVVDFVVEHDDAMLEAERKERAKAAAARRRERKRAEQAAAQAAHLAEVQAPKPAPVDDAGLVIVAADAR